MPKNPNQLFPMFLTSDLALTRTFYTEKLGFKATLEAKEYLQLVSDEADGAELCFMAPHTDKQGREWRPFSGEGVIVSVPTRNADEKYARLERAGVKLLAPPEDKPWGWRSFLAVDPNGIVIDFFHVYKELTPAELSALASK